MLATAPRTTADSTFQLLGLGWAGAEEGVLKELASKLLGEQRPEGGWAQLPRLQSDAYATGEVLVALHEAGRVATSYPAYQHGLRFLLKTQFPDGSWLVRTRLHEPRLVSPPYFESGFPHKENQFISCAGTSWATAALLLALPRVPDPAPPLIDRAAVTPVTKPWMETALFGTPAQLQELLDGGLDPNSRTADGTPLLMMAAPDAEKIGLLLSRGADVNAKSKDNFTALMIAANYRGASEAVRLLLEKGAEVNPPAGVKPLFDASPALFAVWSGDTQILELLVAKGADLNQKMLVLGQFLASPIDIAVIQDDVPMVRYLVRKGADVNKPDTDGGVPAHSGRDGQ